jgi:hypothetical protein
MSTVSRRPAIVIFFLLCAGLGSVAFAGYDVHITRSADWTESEKVPIKLEEWMKYVRSDHEFKLIEPKDANARGDASWTDPDGKREVHFSYSKGEIFVKDPDERIIAKMKQIARKLKARVVGDDGEDYK